MAEPPVPLEYRVPQKRRRQSPALALLLCAPGAACFAILFGDRIISEVFPRWVSEVAGNLFWPIWFVAVATALISLCLYVRFKPLPWYVILNLVINISGLVFSAIELASSI